MTFKNFESSPTPIFKLDVKEKSLNYPQKGYQMNMSGTDCCGSEFYQPFYYTAYFIVCAQKAAEWQNSVFLRETFPSSL